MRNVEGIAERNIETKINVKMYGLLFVFVARFSTTRVTNG